MRQKTRLIALAAGAAALIAPAAVVSANHVRFDTPAVVVAPNAPPPPPAGVTVVTPAPDPTPAQSLRANKIEADDIRGTVHQSQRVKIEDSEGKLKAPEVVASVIYADSINANSVVANEIYVQK